MENNFTKVQIINICNKFYKKLDDIDTKLNKLLKTSIKKTVYYIEVGTGCSCCTEEYGFNFGFFDNKDEPEAIIERWKQGKGEDYTPIGSQYSKFGTYMLRETVIEVLPDGRVIFEDNIYDNEFKKEKF